MRTSGQILDFYDDVGGAQLKEIFPTVTALPESTKTASVLHPDDMEMLPDDAFALVMHDGSTTMRKFACFDGGNTALSMRYFLHNAHKLPDEAQKVAAANLVTAAGWYDLDVPVDLVKIATGEFHKVGGIGGFMARRAMANPLGTALTAVSLPGIISGVPAEIKRNTQALPYAQQAAGSPIVTPAQLRQIKMGSAKLAEVLGTTDMPLSGAKDKPYRRTLAVVKKAGATPIGAESSSEMRPHVDVTNKEASQLRMPQYVNHFALKGRYPIDSYPQVKQAVAYFVDYGPQFPPEHRHEYCANLSKRASALGVEMPRHMRKYGGSEYAPEEDLQAAMEMRRNVIMSPEVADVLEKIAAMRATLPPIVFAQILSEFDKTAGIDQYWDQAIFDPYYSTFGLTEKTAEEECSEFVDVIGNARITGDQLKAVARTKCFKQLFGGDLHDEFKQDPVGIYKSLPREQKLMVINMANDNAPGVRGSFE